MRNKTKVPSVRKRQAAYFRELDRHMDLGKYFNIDYWTILIYVAKKCGYEVIKEGSSFMLKKPKHSKDKIYYDGFAGER